MKTQSQLEDAAVSKSEDLVSYHNFSGIFVIRRWVSAAFIFNILPERFKAKVTRKSNGCWIWTGATTHTPGFPEHAYGKFAADGRDPKSIVCAHRFAYEFVFGPLLLDQLDIDHICQNKLCVNPRHLRAITHQDNCRLRRKKRSRQ